MTALALDQVFFDGCSCDGFNRGDADHSQDLCQAILSHTSLIPNPVLESAINIAKKMLPISYGTESTWLRA
jgi:hypothetical protein